MKKIVLFIMILLLCNFVFADCPPDCDYSSQSDRLIGLQSGDLSPSDERVSVNDLMGLDSSTLSDFASDFPDEIGEVLLQRPELAKYNGMTPEKLSACILAKPDSVNKLDSDDLSKALESDAAGLIGNPVVLSKIDDEVSNGNTFILNNNHEALASWFETKGGIIPQNGASISSFDKESNIVKTGGSESTTFNINDHPGAQITSEGRLILITGTEISSGNIGINENGDVVVVGGVTDISNSQNTNVNIINGEIQDIDKRYSTMEGGFLNVDLEGNKKTFEGENLIVFDKSNNEVSFEFSGKVIYDDEDFIIGENTKFMPYFDGEKSFFFNAEEETYYYVDSQPILEPAQICENGLCYYENLDDYSSVNYCENSQVSCISHTKEKGTIFVKSVDNNMEIVNLDNLVDIDIDEITDESIINLNTDNSHLIFSADPNNPIIIEGIMTEITPDIRYDFNFDQVETSLEGAHTINLIDGEFFICSSCQEKGNCGNYPSKPSEVNGVFQLTGNPEFTNVGETIQRIIPSSMYYDSVQNGDPELFQKLATTDATILSFSGHHYTGQNGIFNQFAETISFESLPRNPNIEVVTFSACHTVMDPEYLREKVANGDSLVYSQYYDNSQTSHYGEFRYTDNANPEFQTAEKFVSTMEKAYPNVRLIAGWETVAPGRDPVVGKIVNVDVLQREGYKAMGDLVIKESKKNSWLGKSQDSTGWRYNMENGKNEGQRMAYYYKDESGVWKYYSAEKIKGVELNFVESERIYAETNSVATNTELDEW
ncbi:hypothetical protein C0585_03120 [Candidatus Woesearchaeota archaeon]|nr:MAG: hypothetical protein C0585_03120 [Candidatus Woesearchaeota archaeon]